MVRNLLLLTSTSQAQAPTVTSLSPARNARSALRNTDVSVGFNQPLSTNAATLGALKVFSAQTSGQKAGTATVSGNTLSFNPSAGFKAGETDGLCDGHGGTERQRHGRHAPYFSVHHGYHPEHRHF